TDKKNLPKEQSTIKVHGRVLLSDGKPAAGAHVAAIGFANRPTEGGDLSSRDEVLGETAADSDGRYELRLPNVSGKTHARANLICRADGAGLAWHPLKLDQPDVEVPFNLVAEQVIRGRLVDIDGKPAANVRMTIEGVSIASKSEMGNGGVGFNADGG